jgi:hypothetical protein
LVVDTEPLRLKRRQRAIRFDGRDGRVHATDELVALLEEKSVVLTDTWELTDLDGDVLVLRVDYFAGSGRRHVLAVGGVEDDGVDLVRFQSGGRVGERVVDPSGLGRLDLLIDVEQSRRADLVAVIGTS